MSYIDSESIIWLMFLGICLGAVYAFFIKRFLGGLVRRLISEKAASESSAMTLSELGYRGISAFFMKKCLSDGSGLRRYVFTVYPETSDEKNERDILIRDKSQEQRYYLPYDKYELAEKRYSDRGTTFGVLILTVVLFFVVALISTVVVPFIIDVMGARTEVGGTPTETFPDNSYTESAEDNASGENPDESFSMLGPGE